MQAMAQAFFRPPMAFISSSVQIGSASLPQAGSGNENPLKKKRLNRNRQFDIITSNITEINVYRISDRIHVVNENPFWNHRVTNIFEDADKNK